MWRKLLGTPHDVAIFVIRVALGGMIWAHGAQKFLGWFGGHGWIDTLRFFEHSLHIPVPLAAVAILTEFFGMAALVLGLFGRVFAAGAATIMVVAVATIHHRFGFYMNWYTDPNRGEGFELHFLALAMAVAIMIRGSGAWSIDRLLVRDRTQRP